MTCGDNLVNVINDILDFSKIESGKLDLEEILVKVYTGEIVPDGSVRIGFSVKDTGISIPPEKLINLFQAFSQVDSSITRRYGGSGLGLAISERLVNLMNGSISVKNNLDGGSTFSFIAEFSKSGKVLYQIPDTKNIAGRRILVVSENTNQLDILNAQLTSWQLKIMLANSAEDALKIINNVAQFDLLIADTKMYKKTTLKMLQAQATSKASHNIVDYYWCGFRGVKSKLTCF